MDLFGGKFIPPIKQNNERQDFLKELNEIGSEAKQEITDKDIPTDWDKNDWKEEVLQNSNDTNKNIINEIIDEEEAELKRLQQELEQDKEDGILLDDEPFYVKDAKLYIVRHQDLIDANLINLAKSVIDNKWKQNINPKNINIVFDLDPNGIVVYESIVCINEFGVRFRVIMEEILEKLQKMPFDD